MLGWLREYYPALLLWPLVIGGIAWAVKAEADGPSIERYCYYGSVSYAQYDGCLTHVGEDDVERRSSEAARFAKGEFDSCGRQSGPLCEDYLADEIGVERVRPHD